MRNKRGGNIAGKADKNLKLEQGGFIFEIRSRKGGDRVIGELAKRWQAFVANSSRVDVAVHLVYYDPGKNFHWPDDRLKPFRPLFKAVLKRFPFEASNNPSALQPEKVLTRIDPADRTIGKIGNRIRGKSRLVYAGTTTSLFFFDPEEKELFIFVGRLHPLLRLLPWRSNGLSSKRAGTIADISNGIMLALSWLLVQKGGLLLHGAGVQKHGQTVLFLGLSGAGKSTVARNCAPDVCFSDDGVILKPINAVPCLLPSLFTQTKIPEQPLRLHKTRLNKLFLLNKGDQDRTEPLDRNLLMNHILLHLIHFFRYFDEQMARQAFENTFKIVAEVPAFNFYFTKSRKGWQDVWQETRRRNTSRRL